MNIQPINNSVSMQGRQNNNAWNNLKNSVVQKIIDVIPEHTHKESAKKLEKWNKIDNWVSKPAQNRGIMGATAILTQPFIDYNNKKVDQETRKMAFLNRLAVILAGTTVGMFIVRGPIHTLTEKMTNLKGNSKFSKALLPKNFLNEIAENEKFLKNYRVALSTSLAVATCAITNFLLDAPLTIYLTNLFHDKLCDKNKNTAKKATEVKNE